MILKEFLSKKVVLEQFEWGLWTQLKIARHGVSGRETMLGYRLTEPVDAWVVTGFELVTRTWPLRATPPVDECSVLHCLLPSVSTYGTIWILSVGLSLHIETRDGLVCLSYGIDTTKWALSIVMCTNVRPTCARTIAVQRKWSAISTGILIAVLCAVKIVSSVVQTTTDICTV